MSCDKCDDIHFAQREGKTCDECKCTCHINRINPLTSPNTPCYPYPYWQVIPHNSPTYTTDPFRGQTFC